MKAMPYSCVIFLQGAIQTVLTYSTLNKPVVPNESCAINKVHNNIIILRPNKVQSSWEPYHKLKHIINHLPQRSGPQSELWTSTTSSHTQTLKKSGPSCSNIS